MEIYVYSDESGTFDFVHEDYFVFGGLIFFSREMRGFVKGRYSNAEHEIRKRWKHAPKELKATNLGSEDRKRLFRLTKDAYRFGVVVHQKTILPTIFMDQGAKRHYLNDVYRFALKRALENLIEQGKFSANEVRGLHVFMDQIPSGARHRQKMLESLEEVFKTGHHNEAWDRFSPPLFPNLAEINLLFCNSAQTTLIRAADIVANHIYNEAKEHDGACYYPLKF